MKDENVIRSEIEQAIEQVDKTLTLDTCEFEYNADERTLAVHFTAKSSSGEMVEINNDWF